MLSIYRSFVKSNKKQGNEISPENPRGNLGVEGVLKNVREIVNLYIIYELIFIS